MRFELARKALAPGAAELGASPASVPVSEPAAWQTEDETGQGTHCRRGQEDHEHHQPHSRPVAGESEDHAEHDHDERSEP